MDKHGAARPFVFWAIMPDYVTHLLIGFSANHNYILLDALRGAEAVFAKM